jgi:transcriptional regulator with XRE-family HTH domain
MKLAVYRTSRGLSHDEMAALVGLVTRNRARAVRRWENGERVPRPTQMARIIAVTAGEVGPADFFDVSFTEPAPSREGVLREKAL